MNEKLNRSQIGPNIHMVNAALMQTGLACDTWAQVEQWADLTLRVHRQYQALRGEEVSEMRAQREASKA